MFKATARRLGSPEPEGRTVPTAENGARQLVILLRAAGWTGDEADAVATLAAGKPLEFRGFTYQVTEIEGDGE